MYDFTNTVVRCVYSEMNQLYVVLQMKNMTTAETDSSGRYVVIEELCNCNALNIQMTCNRMN